MMRCSASRFDSKLQPEPGSSRDGIFGSVMPVTAILYPFRASSVQAPGRKPSRANSAPSVAPRNSRAADTSGSGPNSKSWLPGTHTSYSSSFRREIMIRPLLSRESRVPCSVSPQSMRIAAGFFRSSGASAANSSALPWRSVVQRISTSPPGQGRSRSAARAARRDFTVRWFRKSGRRRRRAPERYICFRRAVRRGCRCRLRSPGSAIR